MTSLEPSVTAPCLDDSIVEQWAIGTLAEAARNVVEQHVGCCDRCRIRIEEERSDGALLELLRAELPEEIASLRRTITAVATDCATCDSSASCDSFPRIEGVRIIRSLGEGGSARVFEAIQHEPRRRIAVRLLRDDHGNARERDRFRRGAALLASLPHPALPTVFALGVTSDGAPFMAMECIDGESLDVMVGALPTPAALLILQQIAEALAHCHAHGISHGDLTPRNVLVTSDGRVKLIDFGLARSDAEDGDALTTSIRGTPAYLAPERFDGAPPAPTSDLFAFGVVSHELLVGRHPYLNTPSGWAAAARAVALDQRATLRELSPSLAPELADTLDRLLAPNPRDRPSASEVAARLRDPPGESIVPSAGRAPITRRGPLLLAIIAVAVAASLYSGANRGALRSSNAAPIEQSVQHPLALSQDLVVNSSAELPALAARLREDRAHANQGDPGAAARVESQLALVLEAMGSFDESAALLEPAIGGAERRLRRGEVISSIRLARLRVAQGRLDEAEALVTRVGDPPLETARGALGGVDSEYYSMRSLLRTAQSRLDEARSDAHAALDHAAGLRRVQAGPTGERRSWFLFQRAQAAFESIASVSGLESDRAAAASSNASP